MRGLFASVLALLGVGILALWGAGSVSAQQELQWFQPGPFELTCPVLRYCQTEEPCVAVQHEFTIRHQPYEGPTFYGFPDGVTASGVLGMIAKPQGTQTLLGSATPDAERFYRVVVFEDGQITIGLSHATDKSTDAIYYGNCSEQVS